MRRALLALLCLAACDESAPLPKVARPLQLLARPTVDGGRLDPATLEGRVVVVNFWSPG